MIAAEMKAVYHSDGNLKEFDTALSYRLRLEKILQEKGKIACEAYFCMRDCVDRKTETEEKHNGMDFLSGKLAKTKRAPEFFRGPLGF